MPQRECDSSVNFSMRCLLSSVVSGIGCFLFTPNNLQYYGIKCARVERYLRWIISLRANYGLLWYFDNFVLYNKVIQIHAINALL